MASQESNNDGSNDSARSKRFPTEQLRKRLQKIFEAAAKQDSQDKYDYAADLYADCLRGDPGNCAYLRCLVTVLQKRYGMRQEAGPDGGIQGPRGEKAALKKAVAKCEWDEALQQGIVAPVANPWDASTLTQMATACRRNISMEEGDATTFTYGDCELFYLRCVRHLCQRQGRRGGVHTTGRGP